MVRRLQAHKEVISRLHYKQARKLHYKQARRLRAGKEVSTQGAARNVTLYVLTEVMESAPATNCISFRLITKLLFSKLRNYFRILTYSIGNVLHMEKSFLNIVPQQPTILASDSLQSAQIILL